MRCALLLSASILTLVAGCTESPKPQDIPIPAHAVIGVEDTQLSADYWIRLARNARRPVLDPPAIAELNDRLVELDESVHDVEGLPAELTGEEVRQWIEDMSQRPKRTLYDESGQEVSPSVLDELTHNLALEAVPDVQRTRYGLVVRRADLRTFPTRLRVFNDSDDTDIDRFQEHALFPGTPVAIVHESRDGHWWFVVSARYRAWIEKSAVAEGDAREVFEYTRKKPYLVVTGAKVRTVYTPELPAVSELQLDMGVRVPLLADWPENQPVNGQHPYTAHVIELPVRNEDGTLSFAAALLPRTADVSSDYLPFTPEQLLRQSFKFLGERYGWGHSYNARDCSGFVSEVYRSLGIQLPRNTRDQAVSPAFKRIAFTESDSHEDRLAVLRELEVGDLVYIPGHVMMVIGHDRGMPYVIHDTTGISYRDSNGSVTRVSLNGVVVTPLTPLVLGAGEPLVDRITSIQRIR